MQAHALISKKRVCSCAHVPLTRSPRLFFPAATTRQAWTAVPLLGCTPAATASLLLQQMVVALLPPAEDGGHTPAAAATPGRQQLLRSCALPACAAVEPQPKLFKHCSRCMGAAYCCREHQAADWKRHKKLDKCCAPSSSG